MDKRFNESSLDIVNNAANDNTPSKFFLFKKILIISLIFGPIIAWLLF
ncbi:MAG: hypothetical protein ACTSXG_02085 [Alphaproteobacteria bacterium]